MKIVIAGEMYSSNLGDRLIYDSLCFLFRHSNPGVQVEALDLSGRSESAGTVEKSKKRMAWIRLAENRFPGPFALLNAVVQQRLCRQRARDVWPALLQDASALVIGGGQLFQDNQLGFPVKLHYLAQEAARRNLPLYVSACGVGGHWSALGRRLFSDVLRTARSVSVRDPLSKQRLEYHVPGIPTTVTFDPAIWSAEVYGAVEEPENERIGLGVIHHLDVNLHLARQRRYTEKDWLIRWVRILAALHNEAIQVELFSNGSPLDQEFAQTLAAALQQELGVGIPVAPRPTSAVELVHTLAHYRGVAAFRMHANILADAYRRPCVGLAWDQKIEAYYEMRGYPQRLLDLYSTTPSLFVNTIQAAMREGVALEGWQQARSKAQQTVQMVLEDLGA